MDILSDLVPPQGHTHAPGAAPAPAVKPPRKSILRHSLKTLLPTTVYAFVFGLLQGGFINSGIALLMAGNAVVLVGIVLAGIVIFFIPEAPETNADIDTIHRFSLLFFVLGIVGLSFLGGGGGGGGCSSHPKRLSWQDSTCSTSAA